MRKTSNPARYLATAVRRFWAKVSVQPNGCWLWTGSLMFRKPGTSSGGYGRFYFRGRYEGAHRWCWERCNGPVPGGLEIDHLCRNRACCNPTHMEAVTHATNIRRGRSWEAEKTHCPSGHPYTPENIYWTRRADGRRYYRKCRTCDLARKSTPEGRAKVRANMARVRASRRSQRPESRVVR